MLRRINTGLDFASKLRTMKKHLNHLVNLLGEVPQVSLQSLLSIYQPVD
jgi:hypothetical protein